MARMIINKDEICFLEIGIPTYNRCRQLARLLTIFAEEVKSITDNVPIRIRVSDNHSSDNTQSMLQQHPFRGSLVVQTNDQNIGGLRNFWGLYQGCRAQYIWIHSDDDIPKPGSLKKIVDMLFEYKPTVLTFEFEQPPGSAQKRHGEKDGIEVLMDLKVAIPHILILGKLTKQVFSANRLQSAMKNVMFSKDTGYGWLMVILEVIKLAPYPKIVIAHEFLAGCDEDYAKVLDPLTIPQIWDDYLLLLDHEIVRANCSEYAQKYRYRHYGYMVSIIYAVMAGMTKGASYQIFRDAGKERPFHISYFRNPFVFLQWVSLRLGIPASLIVCQISEYPGRIKRGIILKIDKIKAIGKQLLSFSE